MAPQPAAWCLCFGGWTINQISFLSSVHFALVKWISCSWHFNSGIQIKNFHSFFQLLIYFTGSVGPSGLCHKFPSSIMCALQPDNESLNRPEQIATAPSILAVMKFEINRFSLLFSAVYIDNKLDKHPKTGAEERDPVCVKSSAIKNRTRKCMGFVSRASETCPFSSPLLQNTKLKHKLGQEQFAFVLLRSVLDSSVCGGLKKYFPFQQSQ